jgi:hypothetical protein
MTSALSPSLSSLQTTTSLFPDAVIHPRGRDLPYGSREYLLLPPHVSVSDLEFEPSLLIASIRAHRNILFDCRLNMIQPQRNSSSSSNSAVAADGDTTDNKQRNGGPRTIQQQPELQQNTNTNTTPTPTTRSPRLVHVCLPLVDAALQDAGILGEQPQAVSTLHGLSSWVVDCLDGPCQESSQVLKNLRAQASQQPMEDDSEKSSSSSSSSAAAASIALGAVCAIATGIPRPGHAVVGVGTYRDGQVAWQALAKEYVQISCSRSSSSSSNAERTTTCRQPTPDYYANYIGSQEAELYQAAGGQLVGIEHLADQQPAYLKSAGGAMARFFFL